VSFFIFIYFVVCCRWRTFDLDSGVYVTSQRCYVSRLHGTPNTHWAKHYGCSVYRLERCRRHWLTLVPAAGRHFHCHINGSPPRSDDDDVTCVAILAAWVAMRSQEAMQAASIWEWKWLPLPMLSPPSGQLREPKWMDAHLTAWSAAGGIASNLMISQPVEFRLWILVKNIENIRLHMTMLYRGEKIEQCYFRSTFCNQK
jgi:hypothetical protein